MSMILFVVRPFRYLCGEPLLQFFSVIFLTAKCFQTGVCLAYGIFGRSTYSSLNHLLILTCQKFYIFLSSFRIIKYVFFLFFSRFSDFSLQCRHHLAWEIYRPLPRTSIIVNSPQIQWTTTLTQSQYFQQYTLCFLQDSMAIASHEYEPCLL